ncbi:hypothetical protein QOZ80_6BG0485800 [Eleusine coracana subsp. coracana]|nr:hypothetical protein QOZ80_6BG0485800 [Eleusine coracana subsp. coracana]
MEDHRKNAGGGTPAVDRLPSDLLESIFLRLPSLLHLVRDFRALHVPGLVAGHYRHDVDAGLGHFSLDFLPDRNWEIADRRGFIYLLLNQEVQDTSSFIFPDLLICEPFTGSYRVIPPLAGFHGCRCIGAFLLDIDNGEEKDGHVVVSSLSGFRVLCTLYRYGVARACVFSSRTGSWTVARCTSDCGVGFLPGPHGIFFAGHCARFSSVSLPAKDMMGRWDRHSVRVVRGDVVRLVCLATDRLKVFRMEAACAGAEGWVLEAEVQLSKATGGLTLLYMEGCFTRPGKIVSETDGRVVVFRPWQEPWLISVDLECLEFRLAGDQDGLMHPYELPWPPIRHCSKV